MPRPVDGSIEMLRAVGFGRRVGPHCVRRLFVRFCREVSRFSDCIDVETAPFEVRFSDPHGFSVVVSPLRELFLVSIGRSRSLDIRVSSPESFCFALDATLRSFLDLQGNAPALAAADN